LIEGVLEIESAFTEKPESSQIGVVDNWGGVVEHWVGLKILTGNEDSTIGIYSETFDDPNDSYGEFSLVSQLQDLC
jgi:hypothetical protein